MSQNPIPQGKYKPAVRHGGLIFTAGMTPRKNGVLLMSGKITPDRPLEDLSLIHISEPTRPY